MKPTKEMRNSLFLIAFGVILYVVLQNLGEISSAFGWLSAALRPILVGLCVAFVINVFLRRLEKILQKTRLFKSRPRALRSVSIVVCMVLTVGLVGITAIVLIPKLVDGVQLIVSLLPQAGEHINEFVTGFMTQHGMEPQVIESAQNYIRSMTNQLLDIIRNSSADVVAFLMSSVMTAASSIFSLVTGFLLAVYVLYHKETIQRYAERTLKRFGIPRWNEKITRFTHISFSIFSHFVEGQLLQSVILGLVCYLGLLLIGIPYSEIIALITALFGLIPILGGWLSGIVSALLVVAASPAQIWIFLIYFLSLQQIIGSFVYPRIVGAQMGLPSLLVVCAILIGQAVAGMVGIMFFVPLSAVLFCFFKESLQKPPRFPQSAP